MSNMKKLLALTLALVMIFSLTCGSFAFADEEEVVEEAVVHVEDEIVEEPAAVVEDVVEETVVEEAAELPEDAAPAEEAAENNLDVAGSESYLAKWDSAEAAAQEAFDTVSQMARDFRSDEITVYANKNDTLCLQTDADIRLDYQPDYSYDEDGNYDYGSRGYAYGDASLMVRFYDDHSDYPDYPEGFRAEESGSYVHISVGETGGSVVFRNSDHNGWYISSSASEYSGSGSAYRNGYVDADVTLTINIVPVDEPLYTPRTVVTTTPGASVAYTVGARMPSIWAIRDSNGKDLTYTKSTLTVPSTRGTYTYYQEGDILQTSDLRRPGSTSYDYSSANSEIRLEVRYPIDITVGSLASGITLSESAINIKTTETATLTATFAPEDTVDKTVTWTSSDPAVATVSDAGVVTAVAEGIATITATANDGSGVSAACEVTVSALTPRAKVRSVSASLSDSTDLKYKVSIDDESLTDYSFVITRVTDGAETVLTPAASAEEYALSTGNVYMLSEENGRQVIRIKVFARYLGSDYKIQLLDGEGNPVALDGYSKIEGGVAYEHTYSVLSYMKLLSETYGGTYTELYNAMIPYAAACGKL